MLNGTKIKDCISTESLLSKFGILSTNQLNAQVKLLETWKAESISGAKSLYQAKSVIKSFVRCIPI